ncbi:hypothetical protein TRVA0_028S00210 [Trichomonascus vanleenenianus]|uniref:uncharacterized protein n=1 Tax=Trichomonascus vanleenenianus TaxID=2268995 RepID=UPI003ECAB4F3
MQDKLDSYLTGQASIYDHSPYSNYARSVLKHVSSDSAHGIYEAFSEVDEERIDQVRENIRNFKPDKPGSAEASDEQKENELGPALLKELQVRRARLDASRREKLNHVKPVVEKLNDLTFGSSKETDKILHDATKDVLALDQALSK